MKGKASPPEKSAISVGDLIGGWGPFQWNIFIFDLTIQMSTMANILSMSFMAPKVDFYCMDYISSLDRYAIPSPASAGSTNYTGRDGLASCDFKGVYGNETTSPCSSFKIDTLTFGTTLTSEYSLVCDRNYLASAAQALYVLGYFIASFAAGWASDRYGRLPVLWVGVVVELIAGIACSFTFSMWFFMTFRFVLGIAVYAKFLTAYTMVIEVAGSKERTIYGPLTRMGRSVGIIVITVAAYYATSFRQLHLLVTLPGAVWLYWLTKIPESPRWLLIKGRIDEAAQVVLRAVQVNGIDLVDQGVSDVHEELQKMYASICASSLGTIVTRGQNNNNKEQEEQHSEEEQNSKLANKSFFDLFRTPLMRRNSIIMCFNWFVVVFIYYALSLNVQDLGGNFYVNFFISGLVEFPSLVVCIYALRIAGRRTILAGSMVVLTAAAAIAVPFFLFEFEGSVATRVTLVMLGTASHYSLHQTHIHIHFTFAKVVSLLSFTLNLLTPFIFYFSFFTFLSFFCR